MPLFLDPTVKGRYVKASVWVKVSDILNATISIDAQGRRLVIARKGGKPAIVYRGEFIDRCKEVIDKEIVP